MFTKIGARYTEAHSREILSTSTTKYLNSKFFKGGKASRIVPAPLDIIRRHFVFPGQGAKSCSVCHVSSINDCDWLSLTPSCPRHSWGFTGKNSRGNLHSLSLVTLALETFTLYSRSLARTIFRLVLVSSAKKKLIKDSSVRGEIISQLFLSKCHPRDWRLKNPQTFAHLVNFSNKRIGHI